MTHTTTSQRQRVNNAHPNGNMSDDGEPAWRRHSPSRGDALALVSASIRARSRSRSLTGSPSRSVTPGSDRTCRRATPSERQRRVQPLRCPLPTRQRRLGHTPHRAWLHCLACRDCRQCPVPEGRATARTVHDNNNQDTRTRLALAVRRQRRAGSAVAHLLQYAYAATEIQDGVSKQAQRFQAA